MVNAITGPPNNYDFGLNFNYAVWTPGTVLSLVNVPWNNDYRDIVRFATKAALNTYIDSLQTEGARIEKLSYVKPNTPVRIPKPINAAMGFNYLRASNPIQPIPGNDVVKDYYYFITDVRYLSPNTTELILQLDVWQTFGYDVTFGTAYVERGHIGIANENQFNNYGRDYLTVPEGIDVGNEYRVITKREDEIVGETWSIDGISNYEYDILVVSTNDLEADPGTITNPIRKISEPSIINNMTTGAGFYIFTEFDGFGPDFHFSAWLRSVKDTPWLTDGIVSVTNVPKLSRYRIVDAPYGKDRAPDKINIIAYPILHKFFTNWRESAEINDYIDVRYRSLNKLKTFPYMVIEMTTWSASPVILKPEAWNNPDALVMERANFLPPAQRVQFYPRSYNSSGQDIEFYGGLTQEAIDAIDWSFPGGEEIKAIVLETYSDKGDDFGDYLDIFTQIGNFPSVPILNNGSLNYLASNNSTISYQRQSAGWAQQRALRSADTGYDQASKGLETSRALNQIGVNADIAQTGNVNRTQVAQTVVSTSANAAGSIAKGAIGGALAGGAGAGIGAGVAAIGAGIDAAGNLINVGIQTAANDEALSIRNAAAAGNLAAQQGQGTYIRDTNKSLADWAAKGDYANEIAGINARVQDAEMIQPTVVGQFGGDAANFAGMTMEFSLRWKLIDNAAIRRIGEYWLRYGYAINTAMRNLPADMMVMSHFTYWKMTETYLVSAPMPESFKQAIRGIFEKGVTVWRNPTDIGTLDYAVNQPIEGISY